jgi:hypothetical protein
LKISNKVRFNQRCIITWGANVKKVWVIFSLVFIGLFLASVFGGKLRDISADGGVGKEAQDHEVTNEMLQFTAGGHVLGLRKGEMFVASGDHSLRVEFVGARAVSPVEEVSQDAGDSRRDAKPLEKVSYRNLWDGVTLVYEKHSSGLLESTYFIQPAGDGAANPVEQIRLRYNVPVNMDESGSLLFSFETGQMKESRPVAWQEIRGERVPVEVSFRVLDEKEAGFSAGHYDPEFPLVIDPVLTWNTFMGSGAGDQGEGIAVDTSGNVYVAGYSVATWGTPENPYAGNWDAFAAKLDSSGVRQWNTFMGSASADYGYDIAVDTSGNVYVTGYSQDTWGTPVNPHVGALNYEAFAAKLSGSDGDLIWNTFMGAAGAGDRGKGIAVDTSGNVYVAGYSQDTWGTPENPYAGDFDAFAAKLDSSGVRQWNTFMGSGSIDRGEDIAVDVSGNVYVTGYSNATWGTPENPYAGDFDAFAVKLDSSGVRQWNTFMGSGSNDRGCGIAVDTSGYVYVAGYSVATWGTPENPYAGDVDAFAAKLNSSGVRQWNTFMGSAGDDDGGYGIAVDTSGNVYVTGYSNATWGTPENPYAGSYDAFAAKLDSSGVRQWNTFMGSASADYGYDIAVDTSGNVYVAGYSVATWGTPENPYAGDFDAFAVKLGKPEINIKYDATNIPDGGSYDFGSHETGTDTDVTFTIENTGTINLTLTTPLSLGGADAGQFSIQEQPTSPVLASGNTTFTIRFTPTSLGSKTASLSISNNDTDENPYNLTLTAGGTVPGPVEGEIKIQAGSDGWANPLRGENVNIYLKPKHSGNVSIKIYNIAGQLVWDEEISVTGGVQEQVVWNCRNKSDEVVSSGIYVVHVKGGGIDTVKKIAVVK